MDRYDLIESICELNSDSPEEYEDWTTEELEELLYNLQKLDKGDCVCSEEKEEESTDVADEIADIF